MDHRHTTRRLRTDAKRSIALLATLSLASLAGCQQGFLWDRRPPDPMGREIVEAQERQGVSPTLSSGNAFARAWQGVKEFFSDAATAVRDGFGGAASQNRVQRSVAKMEDPNFPDQRRDGIFELVRYEFVRSHPQDVYVTRFRQIADDDKSATVRAAAIRALNISRDDGAKDTILRGLDDRDVQVRLEAAKALANLPDDRAVTPLRRIAADAAENKDVRIAATDALRNYRSPEVARTLAGLLNDREFAVTWTARRSLRIITGRDEFYSERAWLAAITETQFAPATQPR
jgi:HEAT repeat protein